MTFKPFHLGKINQFENPDAANDKLDQWLNATRIFYLNSPEYQKLSKANKKAEGSWFDLFMNLYLNYIGQNLKDLDLAAVREIMLDLYPRKMICSDSQAKTIVPELLAYWQFLHRVLNNESLNGGKNRQLKHAESIITFLESIRKKYLDIYNRQHEEDDGDWITDLIADAAHNMADYKRQPSPPDHWLELCHYPNLAEFLDHLCHQGFDPSLPGASEAVFEILNCICQEVFIQIRQGDKDAQKFWHYVEQEIISSHNNYELDSEGLTVLFAVLSAHKQFLSPEFLAFIHQWHVEHTSDMAPHELTPEAIEQSLQLMLEDIPDEFALVSVLKEQLAFLPPEGLELIANALTSSEKGLNGIALMILDDNPERAKIIADVLSINPTAITPATLTRLIRIRNWLAKPVQTIVDKLIQSARKKGVTPLSSESIAEYDILETYLTAVDGSGSQGAMLTVRDGHHHRMISFVLKESVGIVDVLVTPPASKQQIQQYVSMMKKQGMAAEKVALELIHRQLPFFLALNLKSGIAIDYELIQVMELLGVKNWNPESTDLNRLYDPLLPEALSPEDIEVVQRRSEKWTQSAAGQSWFVPLETSGPFKILNHDSFDSFFKDSVEPEREKWSERLGRMALWAHYSTNKNRQKQSRDYAIVSWLLGHSDMPAQEISLLNAIARNSM